MHIVTRHSGCTCVIWLGSDRPRAIGVAHWAGPHAQVAARNPAFHEYRQHLFVEGASAIGPEIAGIATSIPPGGGADGIAEAILAPRLLPLDAGLRHLGRCGDPDAFGCTHVHLATGGSTRHRGPEDRTRIGARCVLLIRRRPGAGRRDFARAVHEVLAGALAGAEGVHEVRSQVYRSWSDTTGDASRVAPDGSREPRDDAGLVLGVGTADDLASALARMTAVAEPLRASCSAILAYPVARTLLYRRDGRPTLAQVKPERRPQLDPARRRLPPPPARAATRSGATPFPPHRLIPTGGPGAEDVVADRAGRLVYGVRDGRILRLDPATGRESVIGHSGGRPLGLEIVDDDVLLVCDARRGLLRMQVATGAVEPLVEHLHDVPLRFCSNATAARDGTIWFTQSSERFDLEHHVGALLEHRGTGRLLRRSPEGDVAILLDGLDFANGLTLDDDEASLIFAETGSHRIRRLWVRGPRQGAVETLADNLPGFPDNLSRMRDGRFWVALAAPRNALLDRLGSSPAWIRKLLWRLPEDVSPKPEHTAWAMQFDRAGRVLADLQQDVPGFAFATGVAEADGVLYLAPAEGTHLLALDLDAGQLSRSAE
jgi:sugar lactone lactonase YvrE